MFLYAFSIAIPSLKDERRSSYRKGIQEHVKLSAAHVIVFMELLTMD